MPDLTTAQWLLAVAAALGIGVSKSGFSGLGMFHIIVFASIFEARASTGALLPMLVVGDVCAVLAFRRHAQWRYVFRLLPPALVGILVGWMLMNRLDEAAYKPLLGAIILGLTLLQAARMARPAWFAEVPHAWWFAWTLGLFAGFATMLANAAGPIVAIYLLAVALPKQEFVGTSAWFFLIINLLKIPLSAQLDLIHPSTLLFDALLAPAIVVGILVGKWLVRRVPQRLFDALLLVLAAAAALRMIGVI